MRNRLDYSYAAQARQDAAAGLKHPKNVPVMFPLPVTRRLEAGFDASLLDDSDETLKRLFRGDTSVLDEAPTKVGWATRAHLWFEGCLPVRRRMLSASRASSWACSYGLRMAC